MFYMFYGWGFPESGSQKVCKPLGLCIVSIVCRAKESKSWAGDARSGHLVWIEKSANEQITRESERFDQSENSRRTFVPSAKFFGITGRFSASQPSLVLLSRRSQDPGRADVLQVLLDCFSILATLENVGPGHGSAFETAPPSNRSKTGDFFVFTRNVQPRLRGSAPNSNHDFVAFTRAPRSPNQVDPRKPHLVCFLLEQKGARWIGYPGLPSVEKFPAGRFRWSDCSSTS